MFSFARAILFIPPVYHLCVLRVLYVWSAHWSLIEPPCVCFRKLDVCYFLFLFFPFSSFPSCISYASSESVSSCPHTGYIFSVHLFWFNRLFPFILFFRQGMNESTILDSSLLTPSASVFVSILHINKATRKKAPEYLRWWPNTDNWIIRIRQVCGWPVVLRQQLNRLRHTKGDVQLIM